MRAGKVRRKAFATRGSNSSPLSAACLRPTHVPSVVTWFDTFEPRFLQMVKCLFGLETKLPR